MKEIDKVLLTLVSIAFVLSAGYSVDTYITRQADIRIESIKAYKPIPTSCYCNHCLSLGYTTVKGEIR